MKTNNLNIFLRTPTIILTPLAVLVISYSISINAVDVRALFGIFPIVLVCMLFTLRQHFTTFLIDERGITSSLLGKSIFIAWDDFKHIGVGELHHFGTRKHSFFLYFSKVPLKNLRISDSNLIKQTERYFYIMYGEGMLEEILKYVDESRIANIDRIRNSSAPHERQKASTSMFKDGL